MEERRAGEAHAQQRLHDVADGAVVRQTDVFSRLHKSAAGGPDAHKALVQWRVAEMTAVQNLEGVTATLLSLPLVYLKICSLTHIAHKPLPLPPNVAANHGSFSEGLKTPSYSLVLTIVAFCKQYCCSTGSWAWSPDHLLRVSSRTLRYSFWISDSTHWCFGFFLFCFFLIQISCESAEAVITL